MTGPYYEVFRGMATDCCTPGMMRAQPVLGLDAKNLSFFGDCVATASGLTSRQEPHVRGQRETQVEGAAHENIE